MAPRRSIEDFLYIDQEIKKGGSLRQIAQRVKCHKEIIRRRIKFLNEIQTQYGYQSGDDIRLLRASYDRSRALEPGNPITWGAIMSVDEFNRRMEA